MQIKLGCQLHLNTCCLSCTLLSFGAAEEREGGTTFLLLQNT